MPVELIWIVAVVGAGIGILGLGLQEMAARYRRPLAKAPARISRR